MKEQKLAPTGKPLRGRNPLTHKKHRREMLRQVLLPLGIALVVITAAAVWLGVSGVGTVERWSEIAVLLLLFPVIALGLVVLALLLGLIYAVSMVLQILPPYARMAQDAIVRIKKQVETGAEISAKPVIQIQSFIAMIEALLGRR